MGAVAIASTDDDDGEEDDGDDDDAMDTEAERSAMKETVLEVVINLTNKGLLGAREANMANDMVLRENPVLVAAFKVRKEQLLLLRTPLPFYFLFVYWELSSFMRGPACFVVDILVWFRRR